MRILNLAVENFRSLESAVIDFDDLTAIVGRNGAGKSTALGALGAFFGLSGQFNEFDYFDCDTTRTIKIRVTFGDLSVQEVREFASYMEGETLTVTKQITTGGTSYRGVRLQIPDFAEVRGRNFNEGRKELKTLVDSGRFEGLEGTVRSQADLTNLLDQYEAAHPELLRPIESDVSFFGPVNVGGGKLDKYTRFVRIPAVRDAAGEVDRKGAILQLIDILVLRSVNARPEVQALNAEFEARIREIFSKENIVELDSIAASVTELLRRYAPGASLKLDFAAVQPPKLPAPQPLASLTEDQFSCPIHYSGHGLQRALIFALLEQLAYTESAVKDVPPEAGAEDREQRPPDLILAIEEPELYLHPPRARFLAKTLRKLAADRSAQSRTQVCYTTHSPFFVGLDRFDQIRMARKVVASGTATRRTVFFRQSPDEAANVLASCAETDVVDYTGKGLLVRSSTIMTPAINEGFFADVVVLVEGATDVAALVTLQEMLGQEWDERGIVVLPAIGKQNLDKPAAIFSGFGIPTYLVFDGDSTAKPADRSKTADCNRRLLRFAGSNVEDFPSTQVGPTCTVFNDDLEAELRQVDTHFYDETRLAIASELGFLRVSQAEKNPEATTLYVKRAYASAKLPPALVDLVHRVTAMADEHQARATRGDEGVPAAQQVVETLSAESASV